MNRMGVSVVEPVFHSTGVLIRPPRQPPVERAVLRAQDLFSQQLEQQRMVDLAAAVRESDHWSLGLDPASHPSTSDGTTRRRMSQSTPAMLPPSSAQAVGLARRPATHHGPRLRRSSSVPRLADQQPLHRLVAGEQLRVGLCGVALGIGGGGLGAAPTEPTSERAAPMAHARLCTMQSPRDSLHVPPSSLQTTKYMKLKRTRIVYRCAYQKAKCECVIVTTRGSTPAPGLRVRLAGSCGLYGLLVPTRPS